MICTICPRKCGIDRQESGSAAGKKGFCGSPLEPVLARAGLHFWEEPVISGTRGSGTVFFSGCNLHCVYCQNYGISTLHQGKPVTVERLREIYEELIAKGAHNINLVTPSHYTHAILQTLEKPLPVPVVYNTNGYDSVETLKRFEGKVQIYLPDLKYADSAMAKRYSGAEDYFETATAAIREMFRQTGSFEIDDDGIMQRGVIIRHLILPGHVTNSLRVLKWIESNFKPGQVMFSLMHQYIPYGRVSDTEFPELNRRITHAEYQRVEDALMDSEIEDGFLQEEPSASQEFIPAFDGSGV